jgi:ABC-2 type transport system permease protein
MSWKRFWAVFMARNREFFRDRSAFGWNFLFPFLIVAGFGMIFGGGNQVAYKIGVFPHTGGKAALSDTQLSRYTDDLKYIEFIGFKTQAQGLDKLKHHKVDLLLKLGSNPVKYWIGESSPNGYLVEKILLASLAPPPENATIIKQAIPGRQIRYIDWLFPGILGMNMMFSALWGVGYVVVRYRKNGVLKRLKATPLNAFEYLSAQMFSRLFLLLFTLLIVWIGCDLIFDFYMAGSYVSLVILFCLGATSLTSMGLVLASRGTSEELTTGILNFISWPMMFLSEVWFSLEGAPEWIKAFAQIFPLTHLLRAVRLVMNDGATLLDVTPEILIMTLTSLVFLTIGALLFKWN